MRHTCIFPLLLGALSASMAAPARSQVADPVVAKRGTATITLSEVDARVGQLPDDVRAGFMNSPERIEQMLQTMLLDEQLAHEARERKLEQLPLFEEEVELAKSQILARRRQQQFLRDLELPDFEALALERYKAAPDQYSVPERLDLVHVLVKDSGRTREDAIALAESIREQAVSGEKPFEELVAEYTDEKNSVDGSRSDGKLRDIRRGMTVPAFQEAAFALKEPGDISPVVETPYGWHVIKLVERKPAELAAFETVKDSIIAKLRKDFIDRASKYHVDSLRSMPIEADPDLVYSLRTRYVPDGAELPGEAADGQGDEAGEGSKVWGSDGKAD